MTRNPCDQFAELKQLKKAASVEGFVDWYKEMHRRLKQLNNANLLHIRFEDFVYKNDKMLDVLCNHISLASSVFSNYQVDLSKKNIGKYKQFLSQKELQIIEHHLSEYIYVK